MGLFLSNPENDHDYVRADSGYCVECFDDFLTLGGFESLIHEEGARKHPLSDAAKELICVSPQSKHVSSMTLAA